MQEETESRPRGSLRRYLPLAVLLLGLAAAYGAGLQDYLSLDVLAERQEDLTAGVEANFFGAATLFLFVYTLAVAFSFPAASVLTIVGGFLFGWQVAAPLVAVAATLGATILFLAARSALAGTLRRQAGPRIQRLRAGFAENAFSYLLVLRLAPIFPFFLVNIAPAFFDVKLRTYVVATFLGILPGTVAYAYLGTGIGSVLEAAAEAGRTVAPGELVTPEITAAFFLLAFVAAIPLLLRRLGLIGRSGKAG